MPLDTTLGRGAAAASPCLRPAQRFSTEGVAPRDQFDAYRAASSGVYGVDPFDGPSAPASFPAEIATWQIGPLALRRIASAGVRYHRSEAQARRDCLDHWVVTVYRAGGARGLCDGAAYDLAGPPPFLCGLHQPLSSARGPSELVSLFVPRDAMPELAGRMDARLGAQIDTPLGGLLALHLDALERAAPRMAAAEAPWAAEATLALLRAAVLATREDVAAARPQLRQALRARLLALVRAHIGSVRLDPDRLARLAGMSRTRLYEVFEPEGGVARAIQRERLRAVRRALADPREARPIAALAEALGFADPSVFSRAFRREFGLTAGEFREQARLGLATCGGGAAAPPHTPETASLAELLRRLRG